MTTTYKLLVLITCILHTNIHAIVCIQDFKIQTVTKQTDIDKVKLNFNSEIKNTKRFIENFINSYRTVIDNEVYPAFKDSFLLTDNKNIHAGCCFSTNA